MLKDLQYERIAQLIALAAVDEHSAPAIQQLKISGTIKNSQGEDVQRGLLVSFSNYVRSQIHLCIIEDLFNRNLFEYAGALKYIHGFKAYRKEACQVLRYFYQDMSKFLIKNPENIFLKVIVDVDFPAESINILQVKNQFTELMSHRSDDSFFERISKFRYASIIDYSGGRHDPLTKIDSYVVAAVLQEQAESKEIKKLIMEDWECN